MLDGIFKRLAVAGTILLGISAPSYADVVLENTCTDAYWTACPSQPYKSNVGVTSNWVGRRFYSVYGMSAYQSADFTVNLPASSKEQEVDVINYCTVNESNCSASNPAEGSKKQSVGQLSVSELSAIPYGGYSKCYVKSINASGKYVARYYNTVCGFMNPDHSIRTGYKNDESPKNEFNQTNLPISLTANRFCIDSANKPISGCTYVGLGGISSKWWADEGNADGVMNLAYKNRTWLTDFTAGGYYPNGLWNDLKSSNLRRFSWFNTCTSSHDANLSSDGINRYSRTCRTPALNAVASLSFINSYAFKSEIGISWSKLTTSQINDLTTWGRTAIGYQVLYRPLSQSSSLPWQRVEFPLATTSAKLTANIVSGETYVVKMALITGVTGSSSIRYYRGTEGVLKVVAQDPPPSISYGQTTLSFTVNQSGSTSVTNSGGAISSCAVSPALPAGLSLSSNCTISGVPSAVQNGVMYSITASNPAGNSSVSIQIVVSAAAPSGTCVAKGVYCLGGCTLAQGSTSSLMCSSSSQGPTYYEYKCISAPSLSPTGTSNNIPVTGTYCM